MIMKPLPPPLSHLLSHDKQDKTTLQALPADATLGTSSATRCCCNSHGKEPSLLLPSECHSYN